MKTILSFFTAIIVLSLTFNCSSQKATSSHYQREWMLVSFDNFTKQEMIEKKAGINLTGEKTANQIKGGATMGCNKIFFTAEFKDNGKVMISGAGSTKMACQNMNLETAFLNKFEKMNQFIIEGHRMTLSDDNGNEMKFVAADWD